MSTLFYTIGCLLVVVAAIGMQILMAKVVQFLWLNLVVPQGPEPISLLFAFTIGLVLQIIFGGLFRSRK